LLIGTGINVEALGADAPHGATSISAETSDDRHVDLDSATEAFIEHLDSGLGRTIEKEKVLSSWRAFAMHQTGDRISVCLQAGEVTGTWDGIDEEGRAMIRHGAEITRISAGDLILL
jgi:biotin-(acetyl-CoA carboxylase) ligase